MPVLDALSPSGKRIRILECALPSCGHVWLQEGKRVDQEHVTFEKLPQQCPSRKCRSRKWNQKG